MASPFNITFESFRIVNLAFTDAPPEVKPSDLLTQVDTFFEAKIEARQMRVEMTIRLFYGEGEKQLEVVRAVIEALFGGLSMDHLKTEGERIIVDRTLMKVYGGLTFSTARGALLLAFGQSKIREVILPVLDPEEFLSRIAAEAEKQAPIEEAIKSEPLTVSPEESIVN